jgi:hypothetical protein
MADRYEYPGRILACDRDPAGCTVEFVEPDFVGARRDAVYYARAIQPATPAVNGDNLRCIDDDNGRCVKTKPCYSDYRGDANDNCYGAVEERAWSSPIYVDYGSGAEGP